MLAVYSDETSWWQNTPPDEMEATLAAYGAFAEEARASGVLVSEAGLEPPTGAKTVRMESGAAVFTDGPFAEGREKLGGYYVLDCATIDEAAEWAAKLPIGDDGCVEIRAIIG
jgi:hypothetical protein